MSNVHHFADLPPDKQRALLDYIDENFIEAKTFNRSHSAYGLKQPFTSRYGDAATHVTSQCFMEAMLVAGFRAELIPNRKEPNWHFNIKLVKPRRRPI